MGDPFFVDVAVRDKNGDVVSSPAVNVTAIDYDGTEPKQTVTDVAGTDGTITMSLSVPAVGLWEVYAKAETSDQIGTTQAERIYVAEAPGLIDPLDSVSGGLITDYTITNNALTETTLD